MSKYRLYTSYNKLVTWIQGRCKICQRFLSKRQFKYCDKCERKLILYSWKVTHKRYMKSEKGKEYYKLKNFVRTHLINIGDYI